MHARGKISVLLILAGLGLLLYPPVSQAWNAHHQTKAVIVSEQQAESMDDVKRRKVLEDAHAYNNGLHEGRINPAEEEGKQLYLDTLDVNNGLMDSISIPSIDVLIPVYHGTSEKVLQTGIGHLEGTSLPVGGKGTHCVLTGHSGLPGSRLFTDLEDVQEKDRFILETLGEKAVYEVDCISVVLPQETDSLVIHGDQDECTLITCTPYGVNTHRLLVHGIRIEEARDAAIVPAHGRRIPWIAIILLVLCSMTECCLVHRWLKRKNSLTG